MKLIKNNISVFCLLFLLGCGHAAEQDKPVKAANNIPNSYTGSNDTVGLGEVSDCRMATENNWQISLKKTQTILGLLVENEIEVYLSTSRAGSQIRPSRDWIGKKAIFFIRKTEEGYQVNSSPFGFSPDSKPFFVWQNSSSSDIESIKKVSGLFSLEDAKLKAGLINTIYDDSIPNYLKETAMGELSARGVNSQEFAKGNLQTFIAWRDSPKLSIGLRLSADFCALMGSPSGYVSDPERIKFLKNMAESKEASQFERGVATRRLEETKHS